MIFFAFSFLASLFGGLSAGKSFDLSFQMGITLDSGPFSKIVAFWPFIVVLVLLLLAILWYQNIRNLKRSKAQGSSRQRPATQSLVLMGFVTVFVVVLLASPYYLKTLDNGHGEEHINTENRTELLLTVHGMDCGGCEALIQRRVSTLEGIESVAASNLREEVFVVYDKSKVSESLIAQTIEDSGYTVAFE